MLPIVTSLSYIQHIVCNSFRWDICLSLTMLPCTWITEGHALSVVACLALSCSLERIWKQTEGGRESPGSSKSTFPNAPLNLVYVTASSAKYRHCGSFFKPVAIFFLKPELHFSFFKNCFAGRILFFFSVNPVFSLQRKHTLFGKCFWNTLWYGSLLFQCLDTKPDSF